MGDYPSMNSTAHISVTRYDRRKSYIMQQAIDGLQIKLIRMPVITLTTADFRCFKHKNDTYTIYVAIEPTMQSDQWFASLSKILNLPKGALTPHITIARTINENAFFKLWPQFKYMKFKQQFKVNALTVLERETLNSKAKWAIGREIKFLIKPKHNRHNKL